MTIADLKNLKSSRSYGDNQPRFSGFSVLGGRVGKDPGNEVAVTICVWVANKSLHKSTKKDG